MNRKQIITSIGVAFLAIGVVGGTWAGIQAMPKVINNVHIAQLKQEEAQVLYNSDKTITKLNIDSKVSSISIRKHDNPNVIVERRGDKGLSTITATDENNELMIKEEPQNTIKETKNIDDIVRYFIDEMYSAKYSEIIVYLPEKVDADIKTSYTGLAVMDDILLDTLNYETSSGNISLSSDLNLKSLNIKSLSEISLVTTEMEGIKNVKVTADSVNIHGENSVDNDSNIPESIEIKTSSKDYDYYAVTISSNTPVAKKIVIDSSSTVEIDLPIVDHKFNFDIKSSRGIEFEASEYDNTSVAKYFKDTEYEDEKDLIREFKGLINEESKDKKEEYLVNINSAFTIFN